MHLALCQVLKGESVERMKSDFRYRWTLWLATAAWVMAFAASRHVTAEPATQPDPNSITGHIDGKIQSAEKLTAVEAIDRALADQQRAAHDQPDPFIFHGTCAADGNFTIPKLPCGRVYDVRIETATGWWEGVNLDYHTDIRAAPPATADDLKWISDFITKTPEFYNSCRVLWLAADHQHATALVALQRTTAFVNQKPSETIFRIELWYFENDFGGWIKDNNTEQVLLRYRGPVGGLPTLWQFVPALGGIKVNADGSAPRVDWKIPAADARRGLVPSK
jgi:hypothetical protein